MKKFVLVGLAAAAASAALGVAAWAQSSLPLPPGSWRDSCGDARAYYQNGARILSARCTKRGGGTEYSTLRYDQCRGDIANSNGRLVCGNPGPIPPVAVPEGSYRQSCRNAYVRNGQLYAECRDRRGNWQRTSIDLASCRGRDIANIDGRLTCTGGGGGGGGQIPQGSYRASCSNAWMSGFTLNALCRDRRGAMVRTSIDIRNCNGRDIANVDGRLTCSGGGGGGGYGSITLCTQPNYGGRCATITSDARGLGPWEMANKAESARVRGRWLVCSEQDYRGRCVTLDRDERNLNRLGFGRRISSVRQTR